MRDLEKLINGAKHSLVAQGNELWQRRHIWIILLAVQIILNMIGQYLPAEFQIVLMASSGVLLLAVSVYAVYTQRSNMIVMLLNIMLFYFNYSLVAAVYWNTDSLHQIFAGYTWVEFLKCINIELIFYGAYAMMLKDNPKACKTVYLLKEKPDYLIVAACSLYIAVAPFLFYNTESFGVRGVVTPLYEYALIVMIVGLCFSRRDNKAIALLLVASAWIILHGLMHGERVLALQMMIVWGLYLLLHILSIKLIIPACIAGIFLFTIFGIFRGATSLNSSSFYFVAKKLLTDGMVNDTSYFAYWASMSIERFASITPFFERLLYLVKYCTYIVAGSAIPNVHLSQLAAQYNTNLGGGYLPFYAYFWLGYLGPLLAGVAVAKLINKITALDVKQKYRNYLSIYLVATAPRWYLYSPATITRGVMFFSLFYFACTMFNKWAPDIWQWVMGKIRCFGATKNR